MRLNTFILTLCACALHTRAASIAAEKRLDALDNVGLDNVAVEPELVDQVTVKDVDNNNLRKTADIPVKIIETAIDENSNDYIPKDEDNIVVKRVEVDLSNPGPPQRQEHETQNPENYGEKEKALYIIQKRIEETEKIFKEGLQGVSDSFKTIFSKDEDLPAIQENIKHLKIAFSDQFVKLDKEIMTHLKPSISQTKTTYDENLAIVENRLEILKKSFNNGIDLLTEGVEVLSIIREEDEAAKAKSLPNDVLAKEETATDVKPQPPASTTQQPATTTVSSNIIFNYLSGLNNAVTNAFTNLSTAVQNIWPGGGQNSVNQSPQVQPTIPEGAQSDTVATPAPTPWGPQAFFQGVQSSLQNFLNFGQNQQNPQQQTAQQPTNSGGPIGQAIQNIVQFMQIPGQTTASQTAINPTPTPEKAPQQATAVQAPEKVQSDSVPSDSVGQTQAAPAQVAQAPQAAAVNQQQPAQVGPIQQLVQNNPIIKGIQSAVQRLQGTPNPEVPRNDMIKNINKESELKGHGGNVSNNGNSDVSRVEEQDQSAKIKPVAEKEIVEDIKPEETIIPSISDKTE